MLLGMATAEAVCAAAGGGGGADALSGVYLAGEHARAPGRSVLRLIPDSFKFEHRVRLDRREAKNPYIEELRQWYGYFGKEFWFHMPNIGIFTDNQCMAHFSRNEVSPLNTRPYLRFTPLAQQPVPAALSLLNLR